MSLENKYKSIISNISDIIIEVGLDGKFTYVSPQIKKSFGYDPKDMIGKPMFKYVHPEDLTTIKEKIDEVIKTGRSVSVEFRTLHKDGHYVPIHAKGSIIKNVNEGRLTGIVRDITDLKTIEQKLKESEQRSRTTLDNLGDSLHVIDENFKIILINSDLAKGLKNLNLEEDIIGKDLLSVFNFLPENVYREYMHVFQTGKPLITEESVMIENQKIYSETRKIPIVDDGKVTRIITIVRNITKNKLAQKELKHSREELRKLNLELEEKVIERTKELQESEENFRKITEQSLVGILIVQENMIIYVNQAVEKLTEYSIQEMMEFTSKEILNIFHPKDRALVLERRRKQIEGDNSMSSISSYRILTKSGEIKWIQTFSKVMDFRGKKATLFTLIDMTDKKIAEEIQKASEEKYRHLFDNAPFSIVLLNSDGIIIDANSLAGNYIGYTKEDLIGKDFRELDLYSTKLLSLLIKKYEILRRGEKPDITAFQIKRKDGTPVWLRAQVSIIKIGKENLFVAIIQDITDIKEAEQKLKESEKMYRNLVNHITDAILELDINGIRTYVSPQFFNITGYTSEESIGGNGFERMHPEDIPKVKNVIEQALKSGEVVSVEFRTKHKDSHYVHCMAKGSVKEINGKMKIIATISDITDRKIAEQKLKESERILREQNLELKKLDELKNDFITIATHELKTPLVSISGYTELSLMQDESLEPELRDNLIRIQANSKRLERHINRLLDVMKIDAKKMELKIRPVNIDKIIKNCIADFQHQLKKKHLDISTEVDNDLHLIVDPFRMADVFSNLLLNAIKYSNKFGKIEITADINNQYCLFKVVDFGKGLSEDEIPQLFQKFVMFDQDLDTFKNGSGLGLYIAKGIINAHGGKIWAKSEGINKGSEFCFTIPIKS
jgi:PAS domain S-box-containing protein